jgi:tripartite-type tricarboxylate transporter receptor subunit TctC
VERAERLRQRNVDITLFAEKGEAGMRLALCFLGDLMGQSARIIPLKSFDRFFFLEVVLDNSYKRTRASSTARKLARCAALFAALGTAAGSACAQSNYPDHPLHLVVGFTAGGISDVLARALAAKLSMQIGQQVVVDNKPGAGTTIAAEYVAKSPADGYTLFLQDMTTHAINVGLYKKLPYDSVKDFTPVSLVASTPLLMVDNPNLQAKTVKELIAVAKAKKGQLAYASSGNGTVPHLAAETFKSLAGADFVHVPFKGSAPAIQAVLAGDTAFTFSTMPPALTQVKAGKLVGLGVTTPKRVATIPDVPTVAESLPGFEFVLYSGILAPKGLPPAIVTRLNSELSKTVHSDDMRQIYLNLGAEQLTDTPAEFAAHINREIPKMIKAVKLSGASID